MAPRLRSRWTFAVPGAANAPRRVRLLRPAPALRVGAAAGAARQHRWSEHRHAQQEEESVQFFRPKTGPWGVVYEAAERPEPRVMPDNSAPATRAVSVTKSR